MSNQTTLNTPSYTNGASAQPLLGMTIGDKFDATCAQYPDNDALIVHFQNIRWDYSTLKQQVDNCARALLSLGVKTGDRVGMWSPNNAQWLITQFATAKARCNSGKHQPGLPATRTGIRPESVRHPFSGHR